MFSGIKEIIDKSDTIYVVAHVNPDGDAIGSSFSTYLALKSIGKDVKVIMRDCSDTFKFLPNINDAVKSVDKDSYDLLICVDSSSTDRLDISGEDFEKASQIIMIDHHKIVMPYGDINCIDDNSPATCELIYYFLKELNITITKDIATYIYAGIITDTGSFNYSSTRPSTLMIASKLIETGIDFATICKKLNHTIKEAKLKLIAKSVENMEVYFDGKFRYSFIDYMTIEKLGLNDEESEGMTNYLNMVEGTEVAAYVREKSDGTCKVSLRSNGKVDVSKIAISFGGGGHERAAGYTMIGETKEEKQKLIQKLGVML